MPEVPEVSWCIGCESFHTTTSMRYGLCPQCTENFNYTPAMKHRDDVLKLCFLGLGLVVWHIWTLL